VSLAVGYFFYFLIILFYFKALCNRKCNADLRSRQDDWKCETGKCGTVKNAGVENAAPDCKGGKCNTGKCGTNMQGWKMRDNRVWKACLRISVPKLILECKNDIVFSPFDTVVSNSCTIYLRVFCVSAFCCLYGPISQNFNGRSCLQ